jgi:hypothetical protein
LWVRLGAYLRVEHLFIATFFRLESLPGTNLLNFFVDIIYNFFRSGTLVSLSRLVYYIIVGSW